jgi:hypothetical protein
MKMPDLTSHNCKPFLFNAVCLLESMGFNSERVRFKFKKQNYKYAPREIIAQSPEQGVTIHDENITLYIDPDQPPFREIKKRWNASHQKGNIDSSTLSKLLWCLGQYQQMAANHSELLRFFTEQSLSEGKAFSGIGRELYDTFDEHEKKSLFAFLPEKRNSQFPIVLTKIFSVILNRTITFNEVCMNGRYPITLHARVEGNDTCDFLLIKKFNLLKTIFIPVIYDVHYLNQFPLAVLDEQCILNDVQLA